MSSNSEPIDRKESFLHENELFVELEANKESKPIGKLKDIDLSENEIWFLQCPKNMNIARFETQQLKIPGRTNIEGSEAISMEFNNGKEQHAFAYYNRKGHYSLRLLPVSGTIIVRDRLKAAETVTSERASECCSPAKRVHLPSALRARHPLLGAQYKDKLCLDESIKKRLQEADESTTKILKENIIIKSKITNHRRNKLLPTESQKFDEDINETESDSEANLKNKKKSKRKHSESLVEKEMDDGETSIKKKKPRKTSKVDEIVSEDLQWLQHI